MYMAHTNPSIAQLKRALQIQEQIEKLKTDLKSVLSGGQSTEGVSTGNGKQASAEPKRKRGSAVKCRLKAALGLLLRWKARWAKSRE